MPLELKLEPIPDAPRLKAHTRFALWAKCITGDEGYRVAVIINEDASMLKLISLDLSIAGSAMMTIALRNSHLRSSDLETLAQLWYKLAHHEESFSDKVKFDHIPVYALKKDKGYRGTPISIFGVNGGGIMGLNPQVSLSLPPSNWKRLSELAEALLRVIPQQGIIEKIQASHLLAIKEKVELLDQSWSQPLDSRLSSNASKKTKSL